jgi:hypothetical protein
MSGLLALFRRVHTFCELSVPIQKVGALLPLLAWKETLWSAHTGDACTRKCLACRGIYRCMYAVSSPHMCVSLLPGGHAAQQLLGILLMFGRQDKGMGRRRRGHER